VCDLGSRSGVIDVCDVAIHEFGHEAEIDPASPMYGAGRVVTSADLPQGLELVGVVERNVVAARGIYGVGVQALGLGHQA
jgi:hypothetical protein